MPIERSRESAVTYLPESELRKDIEELRRAAQNCQGCQLYLRATQTVFGEGTKSSTILVIGEQPGDQEDRTGRPFVGPAGHLLDACMEEAGINRKFVYVTNAVKHFKWEPRGKRRIHKKPSMREVAACHPWLQAEITAIKPKLVICLGATAAQSLLGSSFRVTEKRGQILETSDYPPILTTIHPSSIVRAQTNDDRERERQLFVKDLKTAARF